MPHKTLPLAIALGILILALCSVMAAAEPWNALAKTSAPPAGVPSPTRWLPPSRPGDATPATAAKSRLGTGAPYTMTGWIHDPLGEDLPGVVVSTSDGLSATTGLTGTYWLDNLVTRTRRLTPSLDGWTFVPPVRIVSVPPGSSNADFTAVPLSGPPYAISGRVTSDKGFPFRYPFISTTAGITASGDIDGHYVLAGLAPGSYTLMALSENAPFFEPLSRTVTVPPQATGQDFVAFGVPHAQNVTLAGQLYGPSQAVHISGTTAYLGEGPRLALLDVSDPSAPTLMGRTPALPATIQAIDVEGTHAYLVAGDLWVIDVSDPANPTPVGTCATNEDAAGVVVGGDIAYIADAEAGLRVIDVSDPANPTALGTSSLRGTAEDVAHSGDYVFVAAGAHGLRVLSVADPALPVVVGYLETPDYAQAIAIANGLAFVADGWDGGLRVIDISDPVSPIEVGFSITPWGAKDVAVDGSHVFVAGNRGGLHIIDTENPTRPVQVGEWYGADGNVEVSGGNAFMTNLWEGGMVVVDVADLQNPGEAGRFGGLAEITGVDVEGGLAGVTNLEWEPNNMDTGLHLVDVTEPGAPHEIGFVETPEYALAVAMAGQHAYVADSAAGLMVIDISDPTSPIGLGSVPVGWTLDLAVAGDFAYVGHDSGLNIVDVSDPTNPTQVGSFGAPWGVYGIDLSDGLAYLAAGYDGFHVVDMSNPSNPVAVGSWPAGFEVVDVAVDGTLAYVVGGVEGTLTVLDVSDPTSPIPVGTCDTGRWPDVVEAASGYVYLGVTYWGVEVVDVSDPTDPTPAGTYGMRWYAESLALEANLIFAGGSWSGLAVLDFQGQTRYTASGQVRDELGDPIVGASVSAGEDNTATSNALGTYIVGALVTGTHTLTPSLAGWTFEPVSLTVTVPPDAEGQDFEGSRPIVPTYTVSGWAMDERNEPIAGVVVDYALHVDGGILGGGYVTGTTTFEGWYELANLMPGTYTLTPAKRGWAFFPPSRTVTLPPDEPRVVFRGVPQAGGEELKMVGHLGAPIQAVAVQGTTAFAGERHRLVTLDVSDPSRPAYIGGTEPLSGTVEDVAVDGAHAYVAGGWGGFRVIDVSDVSQPHQIAAIVWPYWIYGVALQDGYAYLAAGRDGGLVVVDIHAPAHPVDTGHLGTIGHATSVAISGTLAFVAAGNSGLVAVDVSDPFLPEELGHAPLPGWAVGVATKGDLAFVADARGRLRVVDVSDPSVPFELGSVAIPGGARDVRVEGDTVAVAGASRLWLVDVSDASNPVILGFRGLPEAALDLGSQSGMAFVANGLSGLRVFDVSDPSAPLELGRYDSRLEADSVATAGAFAYIAANHRLQVLNIADPSNPRAVAFYQPPGSADGVAVDGDYAYIADGSNGLAIVDISNPRSPVEAGLFSDPGSAWVVAIEHPHAYLVSSDAFWVVDVTSPTNPTEAGHCLALGSPTDITLDGGYAYVSDGNAWLQIVDVRVPESPQVVAQLHTPPNARSVAVLDGYAYVASEGAGVRIIDVSDPVHPVEVTGFETRGWTTRIDVIGNIGYATDLYAGILALDLSTPGQPVETGYLNVPWSASVWGLEAGYGRVFVADGTAGLWIVDDLGAPTPLHVRGIQMRYLVPQPDRYLIQSMVRIIDDQGTPIEGAAVDALWTLPNGLPASQSVMTSPAGLARFVLRSMQAGSYQLCVTGASKGGYIYDPGENWETCDSIMVP